MNHEHGECSETAVSRVRARPYELRLLMMVADWTGDDGKGFAKSAKTIASQLHMSERTVHNKLRSLREKGFLRYGNQRIVDDIAPNRRPKVYDMHLPKQRGERNAPQEIKPKNRGERNAPQKTGMNQGCSWHESGMNQGCTQRADNTTKSIETIKTIESNARARKQIPIPADWKPSEEHRALADRLGIDCDIEAEKFRDRASTREPARPTGTRNTATGSSKARNADSPR